MNKEDLIAIGITEEQAVKIMTLLNEDKDFISKLKLDEIIEENKKLKQSVFEYDKQLEDLKKASGDNTALQEQIAALQQQNVEQKKVHEAELAQLKLDNAVEKALFGAKAKNTKAVRAMLDIKKVKFGEDGKLTGLDEQVEALKKSDGYMFEIQQAPQFRGFQPGASTTTPDTAVTGYEARLADARKNNNQLEVIKIKQEAAAEGVILM